MERVPEWTDINPRLGFAYDLFGDSRTALKVSAGRYVGLQTVQLAGRNNPINTSVNSVNRSGETRTVISFRTATCSIRRRTASAEGSRISTSA